MDFFDRRFSRQQQGFWLVMLATLLFSGKSIFIKLAYVYNVPPAILMLIRMMIALPCYVWVLFAQHQRQATQGLAAKPVALMLLLGFFGYYLSSYLDLTGLLYLSASLERLVLYSYPSIVVILSVIFLRQRLDKGLVISLLLTYIGLIVIFAEDIGRLHLDGSGQLWGALLVFLAAVTFAVYLLGSELMLRNIPSRLFTSVTMISASMFILIHYAFNFAWAELLAWPVMVYVYGALIAIVCTVLPSFMLSSGVQKVGAATGSTVGSLGPVVTLIFGSLFLGEQISLMQAGGFVLVILGVLKLGHIDKNGKKTAVL